MYWMSHPLNHLCLIVSYSCTLQGPQYTLGGHTATLVSLWVPQYSQLVPHQHTVLWLPSVVGLQAALNHFTTAGAGTTTIYNRQEYVHNIKLAGVCYSKWKTCPCSSESWCLISLNHSSRRHCCYLVVAVWSWQHSKIDFYTAYMRPLNRLPGLPLHGQGGPGLSHPMQRLLRPEDRDQLRQ